jgi:predicted transcriptional regulator
MVRDTTITMPRSLHTKLKQIADSRDSSMNIMVNTALAHWLARKRCTTAWVNGIVNAGVGAVSQPAGPLCRRREAAAVRRPQRMGRRRRVQTFFPGGVSPRARPGETGVLDGSQAKNNAFDAATREKPYRGCRDARNI